MATHSSIPAWEILWTEPGGLQSKGSQRVGHDLVTNYFLRPMPIGPFMIMFPKNFFRPFCKSLFLRL